MLDLRQPADQILTACSLSAALEAIGERWSFLILRASFGGIEHFEGYQGALGIARNILASRLAHLVDHDILARHAFPGDRRKVAYRLTPKGLALLPAMVALRQWAEQWEKCVPANPALVDSRDRMPIKRMVVSAHDGRTLTAEDLSWCDLSELGRTGDACQGQAIAAYS
jgi:DNA-binding HxlR family transcriptional regulator